MKVPFRKIAKSLTGFSTPIFGVSWNPPESDRDIVRKLIIFFEDRRALYNPYEMDTTQQWVISSVLEIRKKLTETLASLGQDSDITLHLRSMRAACRKFMDETGLKRFSRGTNYGHFFAALGEMRAIFGVHIAQLCVKYGIDAEGDLSSILPIEDDEERKRRIGRNKA